MDARVIKRNLSLILLSFVAFVITTSDVFAQATNLNLPGLSLNFGKGVDLVDTLKILVLFTVITLAPAIIVLCTCFTRIVVILAFMRQAIGSQNMPPNQLLIGLALFLSIFVMQPTGEAIYNKAILPYMDKKITTAQALDEIELGLRGFMSKQTRKADIALYEAKNLGKNKVSRYMKIGDENEY